MVVYKSALRAGISSLVLAMALGSASAQDANAVTARLKSLLQTQGMELGWASATGSGGQIVLEGATLKITGEPDVVKIGNVTLDGVTDADGGYKIGKATFPDYNITQEGLTFQMTGTTIENLTIPPEGSTDPLASLLFYEKADVANMNVKMGDKSVFAMDALHFEMTPPTDGQAMTFSGGSTKMSADLTGVTDPNSKQMIEALGYQNITGGVQVAGTWNPTDGKMAFTQYDMKVDNAGTLGLTFDLGGYTTAFIKSLQDLQKKMAEQPAGADNSAQGMAMLGLMQQLVFNSAEVKFTDDSLTSKVLEYTAKQQGVAPADLANQAKAIVPFMLAQLNNPELTAQASAAIGAFLDSPKSLTISAKPAAPVPFAALMAGGMGNPTELPKLLGVTVTAND